MEYKFQKLEVYQLALQYLEEIYKIAGGFPSSEKYNLRSQVERAGTSVVLNIAEASTGQTDPEQHRILGLALRSFLETVACFDIAERQKFLDSVRRAEISSLADQVFIKLQALRNALRK